MRHAPLLGLFALAAAAFAYWQVLSIALDHPSPGVAAGLVVASSVYVAAVWAVMYVDLVDPVDA